MNDFRINYSKSFKAIKGFLADCSEIDGDVKKYYKFVSKLPSKNHKAIKRHVTAFEEFISSNELAITSRDSEVMSEDLIRYSTSPEDDTGVSFSVKQVVKAATASGDVDAVWKHLMVLSAMLDPDSDARNILKAAQEQAVTTTNNNNPSLDGSREKMFIRESVLAIKKEFGNGQLVNLDILDVVIKVLSSQIVPTILKKYKHGKFNTNKLMESGIEEVEKFDTGKKITPILRSLLGPNGQFDPASILSTLMSQFGASAMNGGGEGGPPNMDMISNLMSMASGGGAPDPQELMKQLASAGGGGGSAPPDPQELLKKLAAGGAPPDPQELMKQLAAGGGGVEKQ